MNEIQIFSNEQFGEVRTINKNGEIFFVARDVATALGYAKPETSVRDRVSDKDTEKCGILTNGGTQEMLCINEAGLYSLIFGSKLESARQFQDWVTHDVLPSIRKTGSFQMTTAGQIQLLAQGQVEIQERIGKIEQDFASFREDLPLFPKELSLIRKEVKTKAMDIVGGKDSPAYIYYRMIVRDIYAQLWRDFDVDSYTDIKRSDLHRVPDSISRYSPPLYLSDLIKNVA